MDGAEGGMPWSLYANGKKKKRKNVKHACSVEHDGEFGVRRMNLNYDTDCEDCMSVKVSSDWI